MKRLSILLISAVAGLFLWAEQATTLSATVPKKPYVPRHEFSIQTGYSFNRVLYSVNGPNSFDVNKETFFLAWLLPSGLEYTYHFNRNWGITTGLGMSLYHLYFGNAYGPFKSYNAGEHPLTGTVCTETEYSFEQSWYPADATLGYQYMYTYYFTVPVMAQALIPFGKSGSWNVYVNGGLKLGFAMKNFTGSPHDIYETLCHVTDFSADTYKLRNSGYLKTGQPYSGQWEEVHPAEDLMSCDDTRKFNLFGSLEAGVRIPVYSLFGIYVGGYVELGFLRMVKKSGQPFFGGDTNTARSVFSAAENSATVTVDGETVTVTPSNRPLLNGLLPFSTGIKVRFAF